MNRRATDVFAGPGGVLAAGAERPGETIVWSLAGPSRKWVMPCAPPRARFGTVLADGTVLLVGRNGETFHAVGTTTLARSDVPRRPVVAGLSERGVVFGRGPIFWEWSNGQWRDQSPPQTDLDFSELLDEGPKDVVAMGNEVAAGVDRFWRLGPGGWSEHQAPFVLSCASGCLVGGREGVLDVTTGERFATGRPVEGLAHAGGRRFFFLSARELFDSNGAVPGCPEGITSLAHFEQQLFVVGSGELFVWRDETWHRLPVDPSV